MAAPNILFLLTDQHNADAIGALSGGLVQTPFLDGLVADGTTFTRAYCQGPLCVPARASLLTERYVSDHGVRDNRWQQARSLPTVVQCIRDAGYHTAAIGKMHLYRYPPDVRDGLPTMRAHGFAEAHEILGKYGMVASRSDYTDELQQRGLLDGYRDFIAARDPHRDDSSLPHWTTEPAPLPTDAHPDAWVGRRAAEWIRDRSGSDPFFLWVGFPGPHDPWDAPAEYVDRYRDTDIPLPGSLSEPRTYGGTFGGYVDDVRSYCDSDSLTPEAIQRVRRHYYAGVSMIDDAIGAILQALRERGELDNTWIVYSSDHGELLGAHRLFTKWLFLEPSVRVPLVIRPPGGRPGHLSDGLVEHVDLCATLRDVAGAAPLPDAAGHSLRDTVCDGAPFSRTVVRSECGRFGMWRTDRYKLVVDEASREPVELFDLTADPEENTDLHDDPAYRDLTRQLMRSHVLGDQAP